MVTVTLVLPGFGGCDVRFDPRLGLAGVIGEMVAAGVLPPLFDGLVWFRSLTTNRLVSALGPLSNERCVDGDVLVAVR